MVLNLLMGITDIYTVKFTSVIWQISPASILYDIWELWSSKITPLMKKLSWLFHALVPLVWFPMPFAGFHSQDIFAILIEFLRIRRSQTRRKSGVEILIPSLQLQTAMKSHCLFPCHNCVIIAPSSITQCSRLAEKRTLKMFPSRSTRDFNAVLTKPGALSSP